MLSCSKSSMACSAFSTNWLSRGEEKTIRPEEADLAPERLHCPCPVTVGENNKGDNCRCYASPWMVRVPYFCLTQKKLPVIFHILFVSNLINQLIWSLYQNITAQLCWWANLKDFQKKARWTTLSVLSLPQRNLYAYNMEIQLSSFCLLREVSTLFFKPQKHIIGRSPSSRG